MTSIEDLAESLGEARPASRALLPARVATGLAQGIALYVLWRIWDHGGKGDGVPQAWVWLYDGLMLATLAKPLVFIGGLGALKRNTLILWTAAAALIAFAAGAFAGAGALPKPYGQPLPEMPVVVCVTALIFIAHHLIAGAEHDRRAIARYLTYFDLAWKHGVQLAMASAFTGVFWIVLNMGAELFKLIGIDAVNRLIYEKWFILPAVGAVFAAAIHLTDVRVGLIRGVRTVALTLLGWLTPLMVFLTGAFLLALIFTGLKPLWATRSASGILIAAGVVMILFINAAYQDGRPERSPPPILRWAVRLGAVLLTPLAAIAVHALWLRIGQYGLTPERVWAAAALLLGVCYAAGYLVAAVRPGGWMKILEPTNVFCAFVAVILLAALLTPLASPERLSVDDQMARVASGRTPADKIDYDFLRWKAGKGGLKALEALKAKGGNIGAKATEALSKTTPYDRQVLAEPKPVDAGQRARQITVYPKGAVLPADFLAQAWDPKDDMLPWCLRAAEGCEAYMLDLNHDGRPEVLLRENDDELRVFSGGRGQPWRYVVAFNLCHDTNLDDLRASKFRAARPQWDAFEIGGHVYDMGFSVCPMYQNVGPYPPKPPQDAPPQMKNAGKLRPVSGTTSF